ncbi:replication initiation protein [Hymenobacter mucosus]|nr:replication initiation protein [Hymenobacter mucosus]
MADKRVARSSSVPMLELDLKYEPEYRGEVKQHWNVTFAHQKKISVYSKRILARVIDQIRDNDYQLREFYQIHVSSILEGTDIEIDTAYSKIKGALYELADVKWEFESIDRSEWYFRHLLDTTKERRVGYKDGIITILLNPQLAPYLVKAAHYSKFPLHGYMNLKSWYSMRFFEILSAFQDKGFWEVPVEEYRQYMDCWYEYDKRGQVKKDKDGNPLLKYPKTKLLIDYTMKEPLKELAGTDYEFTFTPIYEVTRAVKGRKKIIRLRFDLKKGPALKDIPESWLQHTETGSIVQRLREWKVTDRNIVQYAPILKQAGVLELLRAWELKNRSNRHIDDKLRYCNAAFVRAGKQALEDAKQTKIDAKHEAAEAKLIVQQALNL